MSVEKNTRSEGDSNSRYPCEYARFQDRSNAAAPNAFDVSSSSFASCVAARTSPLGTNVRRPTTFQLRAERQVAVLFARTGGSYWGLSGVDPWDKHRDARRYEGADPVVAHPPCSRWCRLAGLVEARWGHLRGEDEGCFASALASVRRCGGVLEHPAYSAAWAAHGLAKPPARGGWIPADFCGGWTCQVEQGRYGHKAKKATWLYAVRVALPTLRWGFTPDKFPGVVSWCRNKVDDDRPRLTSIEALSTPEEFRDLLLSIARTAGGA